MNTCVPAPKDDVEMALIVAGVVEEAGNSQPCLGGH